MNKHREFQESLFPPDSVPLAGSAELNFDITLGSGEMVSVRFRRRYCGSSHFDFEGAAVSATGYYSWFTCKEAQEPDEEVIEAAGRIAEKLAEARRAEIEKEECRAKKERRCRVRREHERDTDGSGGGGRSDYLCPVRNI